MSVLGQLAPFRVALPRHELGQLGDFICVEGDCKTGETLVRQMRTTYSYLTGASSGGAIEAIGESLARKISGITPSDALASAIQRRYGAAVAAVNASLDERETWARRWVPFHPACCDILRIGQQAEKLTRSMLVDAKAAPLPSTPIPTNPLEDLGGGLSKLISTATTMGVVFLLVWGGVRIYEAFGTRTQATAKRTS